MIFRKAASRIPDHAFNVRRANGAADYAAQWEAGNEIRTDCRVRYCCLAELAFGRSKRVASHDSHRTEVETGADRPPANQRTRRIPCACLNRQRQHTRLECTGRSEPPGHERRTICGVSASAPDGTIL